MGTCRLNPNAGAALLYVFAELLIDVGGVSGMGLLHAPGVCV
jgi:hypothetical protein